MSLKLKVINGGAEGDRKQFPDAMLELDEKTFAGQFSRWRLQEVQGGAATRLVDVRDATPDEVERLSAMFSKSLNLEIAE